MSPRQKVAILVAVHLALTVSNAALLRLLEVTRIESEIGLSVAAMLMGVLTGIQIGQTVLVACWGAFANQPWFLRLPRFACLAVWMLLCHSLGESLCDGDRVRMMIEEYIVLLGLPLLVPIAVLFGVRAVSGGCMIGPEAELTPNQWQFGTRRLLLITGEIALLFAIGRWVFPAQFHLDDFVTAVKSLRAVEVLSSSSSLILLPVVLVMLWPAPKRGHFVGVAAYLVASAFGLTWLVKYFQEPIVNSEPLGMSADALNLLVTLTAHFSAAATIVVTFWVIHQIGYRYRRRGGTFGGIPSSKADNSAASASA